MTAANRPHDVRKQLIDCKPLRGTSAWRVGMWRSRTATLCKLPRYVRVYSDKTAGDENITSSDIRGVSSYAPDTTFATPHP